MSLKIRTTLPPGQFPPRFSARVNYGPGPSVGSRLKNWASGKIGANTLSGLRSDMRSAINQVGNMGRRFSSGDTSGVYNQLGKFTKMQKIVIISAISSIPVAMCFLGGFREFILWVRVAYAFLQQYCMCDLPQKILRKIRAWWTIFFFWFRSNFIACKTPQTCPQKLDTALLQQVQNDMGECVRPPPPPAAPCFTRPKTPSPVPVCID